MSLAAGQIAPEIELRDQNNEVHKLSDYRGKPVVLFFYPQDDTPGCTKEACNFRDDISAYRKMGAVVLGVSPDDEDSHAKFSEKFSLPYPLLADVEKKTVNEYAVWVEKNKIGIKYWSTKRVTYLIDPQGKISVIFDPVDPETHSAEVLAALTELPTSL
jgi:peroxiredoxin Q/BCP